MSVVEDIKSNLNDAKLALTLIDLLDKLNPGVVTILVTVAAIRGGATYALSVADRADEPLATEIRKESEEMTALAKDLDAVLADYIAK